MRTSAPYSACVWVAWLPVRSRLSASVMPASHRGMSAGQASAGRSTGRGLSGEVHTVATLTATNAAGDDGDDASPCVRAVTLAACEAAARGAGWRPPGAGGLGGAEGRGRHRH